MTEHSPLNLESIQATLNQIRHCKVLGINAYSFIDRQLVLELPYSEGIIGNPETGVISGGAVTTLLDSACGFSILVRLEEFKFTSTLDLRIDHMTQAKPNQSIFAKAEAYRVTDNIIFTRGIAYQSDENKPLAHCTGAFMRLNKTATEVNPQHG